MVDLLAFLFDHFGCSVVGVVVDDFLENRVEAPLVTVVEEVANAVVLVEASWATISPTVVVPAVYVSSPNRMGWPLGRSSYSSGRWYFTSLSQ
ncbi:hypothetical protein [Halospeciosus flavus]|uniref:hypothetical protein n=1 Tax=Halospeciosus flavus TaxID=3032283 RepID=UPI0036133484